MTEPTVVCAAESIMAALTSESMSLKRLGVIIPYGTVTRRARKIAPWWRLTWPRVIDRQRATLELIRELDHD